MIGFKARHHLDPVPNMGSIKTANEMMKALNGIIQQEKKNRNKNGDVVVAIAVHKRLLKGLDEINTYKLIKLLEAEGYHITPVNRGSLWFLGLNNYRLIVTEEYWEEVLLSGSKYLQGCKSIREGLVKRIRKESYCTFVD